MAMDITKARTIDYMRSNMIANTDESVNHNITVANNDSHYEQVSETDVLVRQICVYIQNCKDLVPIQLTFTNKSYPNKILYCLCTLKYQGWENSIYNSKK